MPNTTNLANDPTSMAVDFPRRFIAEGDNLDDWSRIEPYFDKLRDRDTENAEQLVRWLEDFSELLACVHEVGTDRHVRMTCQTDMAISSTLKFQTRAGDRYPKGPKAQSHDLPRTRTGYGTAGLNGRRPTAP